MQIKGMQIAKEEVQLSLFAGDMIVYISDIKNSMKELLQLLNTFNYVTGYKINSKKAFIALIYTNDKQFEKETRDKPPFKIVTTNIKYLGVTVTKRGQRPV